jgi:hypothetical protein
VFEQNLPNQRNQFYIECPPVCNIVKGVFNILKTVGAKINEQIYLLFRENIFKCTYNCITICWIHCTVLEMRAIVTSSPSSNIFLGNLEHNTLCINTLSTLLHNTEKHSCFCQFRNIVNYSTLPVKQPCKNTRLRKPMIYTCTETFARYTVHILKAICALLCHSESQHNFLFFFISSTT